MRRNTAEVLAGWPFPFQGEASYFWNAFRTME
jgi:hypothetical protein